MRCAALTLVLAFGAFRHAGAGPPMPDRQSRPVAEWLDLLREGNSQETRARAAYNLGFIRPVPTEAIPPLVALLSDRPVSIYAAMSLSQFGRPARPALNKVLHGPDHDAGMLAAMALGWMRKAGLPELTEAMDSPEVEVRLRAVEGFSRADDVGTPGLVRALRDPGEAVRRSALQHTFAGGGTTPHPAVPALRDLCKDPSLHEEAALALRRVTSDHDGCGTP